MTSPPSQCRSATLHVFGGQLVWTDLRCQSCDSTARTITHNHAQLAGVHARAASLCLHSAAPLSLGEWTLSTYGVCCEQSPCHTGSLTRLTLTASLDGVNFSSDLTSRCFVCGVRCGLGPGEAGAPCSLGEQQLTPRCVQEPQGRSHSDIVTEQHFSQMVSPVLRGE